MLEGNGHAVPVPRAHWHGTFPRTDGLAMGATGVVLCQALVTGMSDINKDKFNLWLFFV